MLFPALIVAITLWFAQQPTPQPSTTTDIPRTKAPAAPAIPLPFNANFKGRFSGYLEYRDYSASTPDAPRTKLPMVAELRPSPDGRAVNLEFTYDDGPDQAHPGQRKVVKEREIVAFTADTAILTGTSSAQNEAFHVDGIPAFARSGYGTLLLTGPGKENDKPVDFRITITLTPTTLTWLKESRAAAAPPSPDPNSAAPTNLPPQEPKASASTAPYTFRDQYTLTRAEANTP